MKIKEIPGYICVSFAAILWSLDGILRISLYSISPIVVVFFEHAIGLLMLSVAFYSWYWDLKHITRKQLIAIMIVSLFSGMLGTMLYTQALQKVAYVEFSVVVLLQQLQPIWATLCAVLLLRERITKRFLLYAVIALISSYFMTFKYGVVNIHRDLPTIIAACFALGAGILWGSSTAVSKYSLKNVSFMTGTFLRFFFTTIFSFLTILVFGQFTVTTQISGQQLETFVLIACSTGMIALLFYYFGLKKIRASTSALFELLWPASAVLIDLFVFHKMFTLIQVIGMGMFLTSLYFVVKETRNIELSSKRAR